MLDFVYNCLYRSYNEKEATLLYTNTDSLYLKANVKTYNEFLQRIPVSMQELHFASAGDITPFLGACIASTSVKMM